MPDLQHTLTERFAAALTAAFGPTVANTDPLLRPSVNPDFGDYQANLAMSLGKQLKLKPREVAQKIVDKLDTAGVCDKVGIAGPGFINLHLTREFLAAQAAAMAADARLGVPVIKPAQRVVLDYGGANMAKEMHVGNMRSAIIGDALDRVLEYQGHQVIRQDHLGDWGTPLGMLIQHLIEAHGQEESFSISDLDAFYKESKKKFDADPEFMASARQRVVVLQSGDEQMRQYWQMLIKESLRHLAQVYQRLGIKLTNADVRAESFYNPMLPEVTAELEAKGLAKETQGALGIFLPGYKNKEGEPVPLLIRKSDGGYGYNTTDLAGVRYRAKELGAQRIIYVTDSRQGDRFAQIFEIAELAGWTQGGVKLEHVPFGTVQGEDGKPFKTRSGETVKVTGLLDEAQQRAEATIKEKNPELPENDRRQIAQVVGVGAIKYADLSTDRVKDYVFSWDRLLSFDGNTAPYLQNAYVRIKSIFRKAQSQGVAIPVEAANGTIPPQPFSLREPAERNLVLKLLQFPSVVDAVGQSLEPHRLCTFLYELATGFHQFYEKCSVLGAEDQPTRDSRLALCHLVARTLRQGLELLGIGVVEQM